MDQHFRDGSWPGATNWRTAESNSGNAHASTESKRESDLKLETKRKQRCKNRERVPKRAREGCPRNNKSHSRSRTCRRAASKTGKETQILVHAPKCKPESQEQSRLAARAYFISSTVQLSSALLLRSILTFVMNVIGVTTAFWMLGYWKSGEGTMCYNRQA